MKSDNISNLVKALVEVQKKLKPVHKDEANPFFKSKYASLATIQEGCRELLCANGLAITQMVNATATGASVLTTMLIHTSGEWLSSDYPLTPVKADPQGMGSAISYARRYALAAIVGIVTEDDDGEIAMGRPQQKPQYNSSSQAHNPQQATLNKTNAMKDKYASKSNGGTEYAPIDEQGLPFK